MTSTANTNNPPKDAEFYISQLQDIACNNDIHVTGTPENLSQAIADIANVKKSAEQDRKALKEPFLQGGKKVDASFKPVADLADKIAAPLKQKLSAHLREQERIKREKVEQARLEALEKERKAQALKDDQFVGEMVQADAKQAQYDAKIAQSDAKVNNVKSDNMDRAIGLRTYRKAKVINPDLLVGHYAKHPKVLELCESLANQEIRAAKGNIDIAGIEVIEEKRVA